MKVATVITSFFICTFSDEISEEEIEETTEEIFPVADFSLLLQTLNKLDIEITMVLGSLSPSKIDADTLISNLEEYMLRLGPLTHNMATEETEMLMVAKSVYHQGAPKFLSTPVNTEIFEQVFDKNENKMKLLQTLYDNAGKNWRNFLNMCERHRVEG